MIKTLSWHDAATIEKICTIMSKGGVVAGTSDTVFGLLAPLSDKGKSRLDEIKGRHEKPYIVLVASSDEVAQYAENAQLLQIENIMRACWPGPLTIIFKARHDAPRCLQSPQGTVAIRVPRHQGLLRLLARMGGLFSTSANKAGQAVPATANELNPEIRQAVEALVLDEPMTVSLTAVSSTVVPSTIIDITGPRIVVVREGGYSREDLVRILGADAARLL